jgi:hypothetical protein
MRFRLGAASTLSLTTLTLLVACGGKTISIGGNEPATQSVVPSAVTVATGECNDGYQHANICCTGGDPNATGDNSTAPTCQSWPDDPFHPCDSGWTTYPNAAECCSLDNPADCSTCDSSSTAEACATPPTSVFIDAGPGVDAGTGIPADNCETRCPPGYTGISPYDSKGCCRYNTDGTNECFGESLSSATTNYSDASVPPILLPDGGVYDAGADDAGVVTPDSGCYPPDCQIDAGASTAPVACEFNCPDGWFVADAIEGVCCNNSKSGGEECFAAVFPDDNGGSGGTDVPPSTGTTTPTPIVDASAAP